MDAVPVTLGQEFRAYGAAIDPAGRLLTAALDGLLPLALGGSAAGTGLNTPAGFREKAIARLARMTGETYVPIDDPREGLQSRAAAGQVSAALRDFAVEMTRICQRSASPRLGAVDRPRRDSPSGRPARFVDHAGKGESFARRNA